MSAKRFCFAIALSAATLLLAAASTANAGLIIPASATSDMGNTLSNLGNTINGRGLNAAPRLTATNGLSTPLNSWNSGVGVTTGNIDFDLGEAFVVDGLSFWNNNGLESLNGQLGRNGINGVTIQSSTDGINFVTIAGAPTSFNRVTLSVVQAILGQRRAPQIATFAPVTTQFIRFTVTSNWGSTINTGFSEVAFSGAPVPEPTSLAIGLATAGLAWRTRRKRSVSAV